MKIVFIPFVQKILFVEHTRVMLSAGISLVEALKILIKQCNNRTLGAIIAEIAARVEKGQQFSEVLSEYPKLFPSMYVHMVAAGEVAGNMEETLLQVETQMKRTHELNSRIHGAMIYPVIVITALIAIGIEMLGFVLPKLLTIFEEANVALPLPTRVLIILSDFIVNYGIWLAIIVVAAITGFIFAYRREHIKMVVHTVMLTLPIVGNIIKEISQARFATSMQALLASGISIVDALRISADVVPNRPYRHALAQCAEKITKGTELSALLEEKPKLFPPLITSMIGIGERTGSLEKLLKELAEYYNETVTKTLKNFTTVIEPIIILFLGAVVACMALAVIMPLFALTQAV